jgi:hypothetical protein
MGGSLNYLKRTLALAASLVAHSYVLADDSAAPIDTVTVTASRQDLTGSADTASQGSVTQEEIDLRPVFRTGQLLETMPGLVVTIHSGEGKANQYLLRGENLDHGIDLANFIDDMPINRPTNAHGQGYSDLNFVIPEVIGGLDYTKGPYYASVGDFGAVGSEHMKLVDDLPNQMSASAGTLGDQELFLGGTEHFDTGGKLWGALDLDHLDGPWNPANDFRKVAAAVHYSQGSASDGYSVSGLYYQGNGNLSTDQPLRAIQEGLIGRFGVLDPTDGSRSQRWSLDGHSATEGEGWAFKSNAYYLHSTMTLWNDFTHYLDDPVNGDQEQQDESRDTFGGTAALTVETPLFGLDSDTVVGVQDRYDGEYIDRRHTRRRVVLSYCNDGDGDYSVGNYVCTADRIQLNDGAPYVENTTHWLSWIRTTIGLREDYSTATARSLVSDATGGSAREWLTQPKGNLAFGPWHDSEVYISAGKGFHSDDVRGVLGAVPLQGTQLAVGRVPLMAKSWGEEIGFRTAPLSDLHIQFAAFRQDFSSELIYDQDAGQDQASAPSRRQGFELSAQYNPASWIELSADVAATKARYFKNADTLSNFYQISGGAYVANAPTYIASFGVLIDTLGPWFGGVEERILGPYPLTDGPAKPDAAGYQETNLDIGYKVSSTVTLKASVYNLLNSKAWAAEYYYATDINAQEAAKYGTGGVSDYQVHPLEPISARFTATLTF